MVRIKRRENMEVKGGDEEEMMRRKLKGSDIGTGEYLEEVREGVDAIFKGRRRRTLSYGERSRDRMCVV